MVRINVKINMGRQELLGNFLKIISVNVLSALFWLLPIGINDKVLGDKVIFLTKVRTLF